MYRVTFYVAEAPSGVAIRVPRTAQLGQGLPAASLLQGSGCFQGVHSPRTTERRQGINKNWLGTILLRNTVKQLETAASNAYKLVGHGWGCRGFYLGR